MKLCTDCKIEKEEFCFYKNKARPDGLCNRCRECDKKHQHDPRYRESRKEYSKLWRQIHKKEMRGYQQKYRNSQTQEEREEHNKNQNQKRAENLEFYRRRDRENFQKPSRKLKHKINQAYRRAIQLKATLPGFREEIAKIYESCPPGYHVDHIIPLRGKEVWGLHVPWNLQYLPALENIRKGNRVILKKEGK